MTTNIDDKAPEADASPEASPDGYLFDVFLSYSRKDEEFGRRELAAVRCDVELDSYLLSADGKVLVTVDKGEGRLRSWDVASQRQTASFEREVKRDADAAEGDEYAQSSAALSADGKLFAFSDSTRVELWEVGSARAPTSLSGPEKNVTALKFSPDGRVLAAGDGAGVVRGWDTSARRELFAFMGHRDGVASLAFSPDGRTLASGGGEQDGAVKLYAVASMRELATLTHEPSQPVEANEYLGSEDRVGKLFFTADGASLVSLSDNRVLRVWRGADRPQ